MVNIIYHILENPYVNQVRFNIKDYNTGSVDVFMLETEKESDNTLNHRSGVSDSNS